MTDNINSISTELALVTDEITAATDDADELVRKPLRQTLLNSGKLLRPSMLLWAARSGAAYDRRAVVAASAAMELLHTSTLIHDDIIDDGTMRRGLPAVHCLFGNSVAVYAGDFTIVKCFKILHESGNDALVYDFVMASEKLCKSEIVQFQNRGHELSRTQYIDIAYGKTGALFALAMKSGARLGGFSESEAECFGKLGERFGLAFQIADDCLDYKQSGTVNKNVMNDLKQGLYTMPLIMAIKNDNGYLRALLKKERDEETLSDIRSGVYALDGIGAAKREVEAVLCDCRKRLSELPVVKTDNYFRELLNSMEEQIK